MAEPIVTALIWLNGKERIVEIRGPDAVALDCLIFAGRHGCSDFDVSPLVRPLAARVAELRTRFGLEIEEHWAKRCGRCAPVYVLMTDVEIFNVTDDSSWTG